MKLSDILGDVRYGTKIEIYKTNGTKIIEFECAPDITLGKFPLNRAYLMCEISCIYTEREALCIVVYEFWEDE